MNKGKDKEVFKPLIVTELNNVTLSISMNISSHVNSKLHDNCTFSLKLRKCSQVAFLYTNAGDETRELGYYYLGKQPLCVRNRSALKFPREMGKQNHEVHNPK